MSGLLVVWSFEKSSLKLWIPCSMVFQEPSCSCRSSGQRYLSFTLVKSHVQKLRGLSLLGIPHHVTEISSSLFQYHPKLCHHLQSETRINQLNTDSLGCQVRSFLRWWRLSKDKDSVINSDSNSCAGCESPDSPSSSTGQKDLVLYLLCWTQVTTISLGCPSDFTAAWVTGVSADLFSFPSGYTCCSRILSSVR